MYLISSSIIYLLLKIKILFPLICKFLKGRKSILYSNQSTQTSIYMLPSYCVSFQAWSVQSTQESLRLTTAFSSNQSISVERSHSNCTSLAYPWWIYMFGRYPQHHKGERTYPRIPIIHKCSEWRLHSLVYYMMLVTGTRGRQRLQAQLTVIATPYSSILRGSHQGQIHPETAAPLAWYTSCFTLISPWDNHLLSSQKYLLFTDISILPAILSPLIITSEFFLPGRKATVVCREKLSLLNMAQENLLIQGK